MQQGILAAITISRCFFSDSFPPYITFRGKCDWMPHCQDGPLNREFLFPEGLSVFSTNPLQPQCHLTPKLLTIPWNLTSFPFYYIEICRPNSTKQSKDVRRLSPPVQISELRKRIAITGTRVNSHVCMLIFCMTALPRPLAFLNLIILTCIVTSVISTPHGRNLSDSCFYGNMESIWVHS